MDSTLLGALIGAGVTLAAVVLTAVVNYHFTQKQENLKLRKQKKEELYQSFIEIERAMYLYLLCINNAFYKSEFKLNEIDEKRDKAITKIEMISTIYFLDLKIENVMDVISDFEQNDVYYIRPDRYKGELSAKDLASATAKYHLIEQAVADIKVAIHKL
ncbi:hypothetical protein [Serratia surfactantfaciens]|uniref:Peptidase M14 n=1 Tax=Serratia surfactantfaciens TaxID=2741499 RepID=A0ABS0LTI8_9GAMM|nr:hypothetical protein [Serratia surfactantfaciens]MBH1918628.1 hypothetical protein [Serratia surfactantfaciens]